MRQARARFLVYGRLFPYLSSFTLTVSGSGCPETADADWFEFAQEWAVGAMETGFGGGDALVWGSEVFACDGRLRFGRNTPLAGAVTPR